MPIYTYLKQDGSVIEKIFSVGKAPQVIQLQNGETLKKIITPCMFGHVIDNTKQQDEKKRDQQQRRYMYDYNVQFFNPLKGQSKQQTRQDFQQIKNKLSQQMLQKKQKRRKQQKQKRQKNKRTFKQNLQLYYKGKRQRAMRQFEKKKLSI